jgi:hypothetical protein
MFLSSLLGTQALTTTQSPESCLSQVRLPQLSSTILMLVPPRPPPLPHVEAQSLLRVRVSAIQIVIKITALTLTGQV